MSKFKIANIEPFCDFSIHLPRLCTSEIASSTLIEFEATNAEYSPNECPAKRFGVISKRSRNFL